MSVYLLWGQTRTGKAFRMQGTDQTHGVNIRTLEELFHIIKLREQQFQYDISVSNEICMLQLLSLGLLQGGWLRAPTHFIFYSVSLLFDKVCEIYL